MISINRTIGSVGGNDTSLDTNPINHTPGRVRKHNVAPPDFWRDLGCGDEGSKARGRCPLDPR
jgi:hypothetical protein